MIQAVHERPSLLAGPLPSRGNPLLSEHPLVVAARLCLPRSAGNLLLPHSTMVARRPLGRRERDADVVFHPISTVGLQSGRDLTARLLSIALTRFDGARYSFGMETLADPIGMDLAGGGCRG